MVRMIGSRFSAHHVHLNVSGRAAAHLAVIFVVVVVVVVVIVVVVIVVVVVAVVSEPVAWSLSPTYPRQAGRQAGSLRGAVVTMLFSIAQVVMDPTTASLWISPQLEQIR